MAWQDLKSQGLTNMPGVPVASVVDIADTLWKLNAREGETLPAEQGLSVHYTIGGHKASAYDFLFGKSELRNLSLDDPKQFAISWTTYKDIYVDASASKYLDAYANTLTSAPAGTEAFWPMIAGYGIPYNLLIIRRVTDPRFAVLKTLFGGYSGYLQGLPEQLLREGRLYEIDLSMFESFLPWYYDINDNKRLHCNPATVTLLERIEKKIGVFEPRLIRVLIPGPGISPGRGNVPHTVDFYSAAGFSLTIQRGLIPDAVSMNHTKDGAWLYALQAAKTSVTLYGIWLGHVYHWHIVTAAMFGTMSDTLPQGHAIYQLLQPQSNHLIAFDYVLLNWKEIDLFSKIAPPSCIGDPDAFLKLTDMFATDRQFFDDDPKTELEKNGLEEAHFTREKAWDMYPVAQNLLRIWDICERFLSTFVSVTYADDRAVATDNALQNWMKASADPGQGNIRGLPVMDNREALSKVLTSLVYRVTAHGISRLTNTANPALSFVANFPPCLQDTDFPYRDDDLKTQELLKYLPNTGTIGEMLKFYFAFGFSKPYAPLIPTGGLDQELYFSGGTQERRNAALVAFRKEMKDFMWRYQTGQSGEEGITGVGIQYQVRVENAGWQDWVQNGQDAGTTDQKLRLEAIRIRLNDAPKGVGVRYRGYFENIGWQDWVQNGQQAGTTDQKLRLEAIEIELVDGDPTRNLGVIYKPYLEDMGWQPFVGNGTQAGTIGQSRRLEAIRIVLAHTKLKTFEYGPDSQEVDRRTPQIQYQAHVESIGWQDWVQNGQQAGTTGKKQRLEAIRIKLNDAPEGVGVRYRGCVENIGWQDWVQNGQQAGTTDRKLRLEAIEIELVDGDPTRNLGVIYKPHFEAMGWQPFVGNGAQAGTTGESRRLEAVRIVLAHTKLRTFQHQSASLYQWPRNIET